MLALGDFVFPPIQRESTVFFMPILAYNKPELDQIYLPWLGRLLLKLSSSFHLGASMGFLPTTYVTSNVVII